MGRSGNWRCILKRCLAAISPGSILTRCPAVWVQKAKAQAFPGMGKGPTGVIKSILDTSRTGGQSREEIFVDIVEKISATFSSSGHLQTSQIDGAIQVGGAASGMLPCRCSCLACCRHVGHGGHCKAFSRHTEGPETGISHRDIFQ